MRLGKFVGINIEKLRHYDIITVTDYIRSESGRASGIWAQSDPEEYITDVLGYFLECDVTAFAFHETGEYGRKIPGKWEFQKECRVVVAPERIKNERERN